MRSDTDDTPFSEFERELRRDVDDAGIDYSAIEARLMERIDKAESLGSLSLLAADELPAEALLEQVGEAVDQRIREHVEYEEPLDECISRHELCEPPLLREVEAKLDTRIEAAAGLPPWQAVLKADEVLALGTAEAVEAKLDQRLSDHAAGLARARQSAWFSLRFALRGYRAPVAAAVLALIALAGYWGVSGVRALMSSVPVVVYQVQGDDTRDIKAILVPGDAVRSSMGGSITVVGPRGYADVRNGSQLEIVKSTRTSVAYRASFADVKSQLVGRGSIAFFVTKKQRGERFGVATPDYRLEVVGTYFRLQPDVGGHISLSVKEGSVRTFFADGDVRTIDAGQVLSFDLSTNGYVVRTDGGVVDRATVDIVPSLGELRGCRRLCVQASVPGAEVRIDGATIGVAPLAILEPAGAHRIHLERSGWAALDTMVSLGADSDRTVSLTLAKPAPEPAVAAVVGSAVVPGGLPSRVHTQASSLPTAAVTPGGSERNFREAEAAGKTDWRAALALYRKVFDDPLSPALRRDAALFCMAQLCGDHGDRAQCAALLKSYLDLFPSGYFTGEALLRMAEMTLASDENAAAGYYLLYCERFPHQAKVSEFEHRVGLIYLQQKRFDEAIDMFKQSLANMPDTDAARKQEIYGDLYKAMREKNQLPTAAASPSPGAPSR